jgi:hypothetical protein
MSSIEAHNPVIFRILLAKARSFDESGIPPEKNRKEQEIALLPWRNGEILFTYLCK